MAEPTPEYRRDAEADCLRTFITFYRCLDAGDYDGVLALWHPDGTWMRQRLFRKQEFMESLVRRSTTAVVHHIVTNTVFAIAQGRADFTCYVTSLTGDIGEPATGPIPARSMRIYLCKGALVESDGEWLMHHYDPGKPRLHLLAPGVPEKL